MKVKLKLNGVDWEYELFMQYQRDKLGKVQAEF